MKTRIKTVIHNNGSPIYYPQYKGWFFWHTFTEHIGYDCHLDIYFQESTECEKFIDDYLDKFVITTTTTTYRNYP